MVKRLLTSAMVLLVGLTGWALDQKDGVYQIGSADDLQAFAELVNGGETTANAVLTADVEYSNTGALIGATTDKAFAGTFDGQGHKVTLNFEGGENTSLFPQLAGTICNLTVDGTIATSGKFAAGIASHSRAASTLLKNCAVFVNIVSSVDGDATHGGILGVADSGATLENCWFGGTISGEKSKYCGGLVGFASTKTYLNNCLNTGKMELAAAYNAVFSRDSSNAGTNPIVTNCYYCGDFECCTTGGGTFNKATAVTPEQLASGEACFLLNGDQSKIAWYQTIGEDTTPVLDATHKRVNAEGQLDCAGKPVGDMTYSNNEGGATVPDHTYADGEYVCSVCGHFNDEYCQLVDGWYEIGTPAQLKWFAYMVNNGKSNINGKLTADIDFSECQDHIGNPGFYGNFDGQGHKITLNYTSTSRNTALFNDLYGGTISNLIIDGTINDSHGFAATVAVHSRNADTKLFNIISYVNIISTYSGDATNGGLIAVTDNGATLENCCFAGSIDGPEAAYSGGLVGFASSKTFLKSCLMVGTLNLASGYNAVFSRDSGNAGTNPVLTNCYYFGTYECCMEDGGTFNEAPQAEESKLADGTICYALNGAPDAFNWNQTIGTDPYPVPNSIGHKPVYVTAHLNCAGQVKGDASYSNEGPANVEQDEHNFYNGTCLDCGATDTSFAQQDENGFYLISNPDQLVWFSNFVNTGNKTACAKLEEDINLSEVANFPMIGSGSTNSFCGTFDGQGHTISGLHIESMTGDSGMFGLIGAGCVIKNCIFDSTCYISGGAHTGLVGATDGSAGEAYLTNLGYEGNCDGSQNTGALFGCNMNSAPSVFIDNCYSTGVINSSAEGGTLAGYCKEGRINNCWSNAQINADGYYTPANKPFALVYCATKNNYIVTDYPLNPDFDIQRITQEDVESGALCWMLNANSGQEEPIWFQNIGEDAHPVLDNTHGIVYQLGDQYGYYNDDATFAEYMKLYAQYLQNFTEDLVATQSLIDAFNEKVEATGEATSAEELKALRAEMDADINVLKESAAAYVAYQTKLDEVKAYLDGDDTFWGDDRDLLENYLENDEEPCEDFANGGAVYIMENHVLTTEEIKAETVHVQEMLDKAIQNGFGIGSDISNFIVNPKFLDGANGWNIEEGTVATAVGVPDVMGAFEAFNTTINIQQTITGLRDGFYLVRANGVFRCLPWEENNGYCAMLFANDNSVYFKNYFDEYVLAEDAQDGVNCHLTGNITDLSFKDEEGNILYYVPQGPLGGSIHFNAGNYETCIIAEVTDGNLTLGVKNTGTGNDRDWVVASNFRLYYMGDDAESASESMDEVLAGMAERANTIMGYTPNSYQYKYFPNFSASLLEEISSAIDAVEGAVEPTDKMELIKKFSDLFEAIPASKKAYRSYAGDLEEFLTAVDEMHNNEVISDEEFDAENQLYNTIFDKWLAGEYSTEEALAEEELKSSKCYNNVFGAVPELVDGFYQINEPANLSWFAKKVASGETRYNAVVNADLDMTGYPLPIMGNTDQYYTGTFDGQGHTFSNINIQSSNDYTGFFGVVGPGAVIKNFVFDSTCSISGGSFSGIVGGTAQVAGDVYLTNIGMEGTVKGIKNTGAIFGCNMGATATVYIDNCYSMGAVVGDNESGALTGYIRTGRIYNCWSSAEITGYYSAADKPFALVYCDTKNNYMMTDYTINPEFDIQHITADQIASGELCYLLNSNSGESAPIWFQTIGEDAHPVLDNTHGIVDLVDGKFTNVEGTPEYQPDYSKPLLVETSQLTDNCYWVYAALDMSVNTLLDGSTTTHFHSDATNATSLSSLNEYIQMDLREEQNAVQLYFAGRDLQPIGPVTNPNLTMINNPNHIIILGTNTPENEESWEQVADLNEGFPGQVEAGEYFSPVLTFNTPYRYLRMVVKGATGSDIYWNISELQVYACTTDAIQQIAEKTNTISSGVYDLQGRRYNATQKLNSGLYIIDGKKVIVK